MTEWEEDCKRWRGKTLVGRYAHWCMEWDALPVDETTFEFDCCTCFTPEQLADPEFRTVHTK